jgi:transcriptional regulator with XRE-family HTH domain
MSISEKLKQARAETDLTQEVIAEKVGVSRQSVHNWENGKSYPDITSVIALSDVYNISLDSLLKGDTNMIEHLEEGTGKGKKVKYVIVSILALAVVMVGIWLSFALLGTSLRWYIDLPSLYLLIIPLIFILTITRSYKLFYLGLRTLIFPKIQISEEQRIHTISLFRLMSKTAAIAAAIITITAVVSLFVGLDVARDDFLFQLSMSIAIFLIVPLYSLIMILVIFEPVVFILKKK